jgi:hypothetical protein
MKIVLLLFVACVASAAADHFVEFDWSNVKLVRELPGFWEKRDLSIRPPARIFSAPRTRRIVNGEIAT